MTHGGQGVGLLVVLALLVGCDMPRRSGVEGRPTPSLGSRLGGEAALRGVVVWRKMGRPREAVRVPGGPFTRGSDEEALGRAASLCKKTYARPRQCKASWFERESPQKQIVLNTFYIDRFEVTNAQFGACVEAGACTAPRYSDCDVLDPKTGQRSAGGPVSGALKAAEHPVVCVDWSQARAFCAFVGGRLPTEAEWEKAARGPDDARALPWGDVWDPSRLNWGETGGPGSSDGHAQTAPVGSYPEGVSPYGVHDMAGNVWEWTLDWFDEGFYARAAEKNPLNETATRYKVLRGGAWSFAGNGARVAYRHFGAPEGVDDGVGFRCVRYPKR